MVAHIMTTVITWFNSNSLILDTENTKYMPFESYKDALPILSVINVHYTKFVNNNYKNCRCHTKSELLQAIHAQESQLIF